jgi:hypothetical protein
VVGEKLSLVLGFVEELELDGVSHGSREQGTGERGTVIPSWRSE